MSACRALAATAVRIFCEAAIASSACASASIASSVARTCAACAAAITSAASSIAPKKQPGLGSEEALAQHRPAGLGDRLEKRLRPGMLDEQECECCPGQQGLGEGRSEEHTS